MKSFIKAYGVDKKNIFFLKNTHLGRDLEVQRFPKLRSKLEFVSSLKSRFNIKVIVNYTDFI